MGGVLILLALSISTLLWANLSNPYVWIVLWVTIGFGLIGFSDDYLKLTRRSHKGLPGRFKLLGQVLIAGIATAAIIKISPPDLETALAVPFLKDVLLNLGIGFAVVSIFVMVGASSVRKPVLAPPL